ncbi:hypothetical protein POVWA1_038810 [Plasmodium ovale wallikeri]|uniref:Uncharacterized protein n=1 Tax=Plasmodium ovale wallikeri TaxID=864142 RepID=A0A1A8Z4G4_PLAOA|nr:hypothetical protein POVWA1_038810 [Plasmodium ovale wallikeri]
MSTDDRLLIAWPTDTVKRDLCINSINYREYAGMNNGGKRNSIGCKEEKKKKKKKKKKTMTSNFSITRN